jgi:hypothetical protein
MTSQFDTWSEDEYTEPKLYRRQTHRIEQIWKHLRLWSEGEKDRHEPKDWQTWDVLCRNGSTMDTLVGTNDKRRDVTVINTCAYTIYVSPNRSTGFGNTGAPIASNGSLTLRTRGAVFGCCPSGASLTPPQDQSVTIIEELYKA